MYINLTEDSFIIYAAKHYDTKRSSSTEEFHDDLKRIQYLKRLFRRYEETGELKVRLILNHLIIIYNCFGVAATNMLFMKLPEYHSYLKTFALFLNYMPKIIEYNNETIIADKIEIDLKITRELQQI